VPHNLFKNFLADKRNQISYFQSPWLSTASMMSYDLDPTQKVPELLEL
jgi:hypothetical protein